MNRHRVCLDCENRHIGCHSACEWYIEECKQLAEEKQKKLDATLGERELAAYIRERSIKTYWKWKRNHKK